MFEKQKKYFTNLINNNLLGHAYLFVGQDTKNLLRFSEYITILLTGRNFDNNPDVNIIRPATQEEKHKIDIKSIRDLKLFMRFKPYYGNYKIVIIENAETISDAAANAMLKILEEPTKHVIFILISSRPGLILKTILSRCEKVVFPPVQQSLTTEEMNKALEELRKVAKQNISERIQYAKKIFEKGEYPELVEKWLKSLQLRLPNEPKLVPILKNLLRLSQIISQPQYNHRLALENFLINI
jgi:hypothetical protein